MQVCWLIFLVFTFICPLPTKSEINSVLINKFELSHVYYTKLLRSWTLNQTSWDLVLTCYDSFPTSTDYVYNVPNIEWTLTQQITPVVVTDQISWPNSPIPADQLIEYSTIIPSGSDLAGKTYGNLYYMDRENPIALVPDDKKTNWFYHDAEFKDMDLDGHIDVVAGRGNVPLIHGAPTTQLIWLKNPGNYTIRGPWNLTYIRQDGGPEMQLQFAYVDSRQVLFANSYYERTLQMYWSDAEPYWGNASRIHLRHIDYEPFQFAYVQYTMDLNGDQIYDLLVSVSNDFDGSLIVYELPPTGELFNGTFKKNIIASGFKPSGSGKGRAPGQGIPYQFYSLTVRKKPIIILSGDDDGCVYLLEAVHDDDPLDWQYSMKTIHKSEQSTIGQISIEDVDNDGHPELFVPAYNDGIVYIYRLIDN